MVKKTRIGALTVNLAMTAALSRSNFMWKAVMSSVAPVAAGSASTVIASHATMPIFRSSEGASLPLMLHTTLISMKHLVIILLLSMFAFEADAHRDMWLKISEDGKLSPLPEEYAATRVQIELSNQNSSKVTKFAFTSTSKTTVVQNCLLRLVPEISHSQI